MGRRQFHAGVNGLSSHFLNVLHWWFSIYFLLRDSENDLKFTMLVQPNFNPLSNVANAVENNHSALESVFNSGFSQIGSHMHPTETAIRRVVV